jgi:hypothetical protein
LCANSDISDNIVKIPNCYGGDSTFSIATCAGPWCEELKYDESRGGFEGMIEHEDDQEDVFAERDNFDMGDLKAQL